MLLLQQVCGGEGGRTGKDGEGRGRGIVSSPGTVHFIVVTYPSFQ